MYRHVHACVFLIVRFGVFILFKNMNFQALERRIDVNMKSKLLEVDVNSFKVNILDYNVNISTTVYNMI